MPIESRALADDPRFFLAFRHGARVLLQLHDGDPRIGALFSSQQRWLMCHAAFALACSHDPQVPGSGLYAAPFIELVVEKNVASRNTAADFIKEVVGFGFARPVANHDDRRKRLLQPTEVARRAMSDWLELHLTVLDGLDGGTRTERYRSDPTMTGRLQPTIAERLFDTIGVRYQGPAFDHFTWANAGGLVLDHLIASLELGDAHAAPLADRIPAGKISLAEVSRRFRISRTHAKRMLGKAVEMGEIGWSAGRGESDVWVSRRLVGEYWRYQAEKYALVDCAFHAMIGREAERSDLRSSARMAAGVGEADPA
jgi:hypothetical protein